METIRQSLLPRPAVEPRCPCPACLCCCCRHVPALGVAQAAVCLAAEDGECRCERTPARVIPRAPRPQDLRTVNVYSPFGSGMRPFVPVEFDAEDVREIEAERERAPVLVVPIRNWLEMTSVHGDGESDALPTGPPLRDMRPRWVNAAGEVVARAR